MVAPADPLSLATTPLPAYNALMLRRSGKLSRAGIALWEYLALGLIAVTVLVGGRWLMVSDSSDKARDATVKRVQVVGAALDKYGADNGGAFPSAGQGLAALLSRPTKGTLPVNWNGPYLRDATALHDGWGREFHYVAPGGGDPPRAYDLWSLGPTGREGGTGPNAEIESWDRTTWLLPRP